MLPPSLDLCECPILASDDVDVARQLKLFFSVYQLINSDAAPGRRPLAKHKVLNTMHLVIVDVLSNTLQWNPSMA